MTLEQAWAQWRANVLARYPPEWVEIIEQAFFLGASAAGAVISEAFDHGHMAALTALLQLSHDIDRHKPQEHRETVQ